MTKEQAERLALRIAQKLFTDGSGREATRLAMMHKTADDKERMGCGWGKFVVRDMIFRELLTEHLE